MSFSVGLFLRYPRDADTHLLFYWHDKLGYHEIRFVHSRFHENCYSLSKCHYGINEHRIMNTIKNRVSQVTYANLG